MILNRENLKRVIYNRISEVDGITDIQVEAVKFRIKSDEISDGGMLNWAAQIGIRFDG